MKNEVNNIDPREGLPGKLPFTVPDSYFDDFEARLQVKLQQQSLKPETGNKLVRVLKPVMWLAASFLLIVLLVKIPLGKFFPEYMSGNLTEEEYPISIESLDEDEFYDIITDDLHAESLETNEIFDFLTYEVSEFEIYSEMYN